MPTGASLLFGKLSHRRRYHEPKSISSIGRNRVANFHKNTLNVVKEMIEATGLNHPNELCRRHIVRRVSSGQILLADQLFPKVQPNALITGGKCDDPRLDVYWDRVDGSSFSARES